MNEEELLPQPEFDCLVVSAPGLFGCMVAVGQFGETPPAATGFFPMETPVVISFSSLQAESRADAPESSSPSAGLEHPLP